jgi:hypothetical protein
VVGCNRDRRQGHADKRCTIGRFNAVIPVHRHAVLVVVNEMLTMDGRSFLNIMFILRAAERNAKLPVRLLSNNGARNVRKVRAP